MMTDATKAKVWEASYLPFGGLNTITGSASMNARFPGQWFQLESGLHYNWHRHYDATIARYTQPDPLGLIDGPSVYAYVTNSPQIYTDPDGMQRRSVPRYTRSQASRADQYRKTMNEIGRYDPSYRDSYAANNGYVPTARHLRRLQRKLDQLRKDATSRNACPAGGPSGKPPLHFPTFSSIKRAKEAAKQHGNSKPIKHATPRVGKPHFHSTRNGVKKRGGPHFTYPKK